MTAALDPDRALAFLGLLSTDIRGGAVMDEHGALLAGSSDVAAVAGAIGTSSAEGIIHRAMADGSLVAVSSRRRTVAVEVGPHALIGLVEHDIRRALRELS